ncbi:hypothetical protein ABKN59_006323 [Abortiporus biennis]
MTIGQTSGSPCLLQILATFNNNRALLPLLETSILMMDNVDVIVPNACSILLNCVSQYDVSHEHASMNS